MSILLCLCALGIPLPALCVLMQHSQGACRVLCHALNVKYQSRAPPGLTLEVTKVPGHILSNLWNLANINITGLNVMHIPLYQFTTSPRFNDTCTKQLFIGWNWKLKERMIVCSLTTLQPCSLSHFYDNYSLIFYMLAEKSVRKDLLNYLNIAFSLGTD